MLILKTSGWDGYQLLDSGDGERLERFGDFTLIRPDPQVIWKKSNSTAWIKADAVFQKTSSDKGQWKVNKKMPEKWLISYKDLEFYAKLTPFKHTGVFPEQHLQWDFIHECIKNAGREVNVLNLFAYTGIASIAAAKAGAKVTHLDASYPSVGWAKENQQASGLKEDSIRWILDDALKFVTREIKRGVKYDGIIMDPPIYGHGPSGEKWEFSESFPKLVEACGQILSDKPLFLIVNAYAISSSALMLENVLNDYLPNGNVEVGELVLEETSSKRLLSTGIFARWTPS